MNAIGATAQCRSWCSRSCHTSTLIPSADAYEAATVPTTTNPATGLRSMAVTITKIRTSAAATSKAVSRATNRCRSAVAARELDVLTLIGKGRSNSEIADELCISNVTVKSHIGRIFGKLDLRDRAAAIVYAYDNGIVAPR